MLFKIGFCEIKMYLGISGFWDNVISPLSSTAFYNLPQQKKENKKQKQNDKYVRMERFGAFSRSLKGGCWNNIIPLYITVPHIVRTFRLSLKS